MPVREVALLRTKRVYEPPAPDDGVRVLVDRLWPRGLTKEAARVGRWLRELAPSPELRRWYGHEPARYPGFRSRFREELLRHRTLLESLVRESEKGTVTLLYASRVYAQCNAQVLHELLEELRRAS